MTFFTERRKAAKFVLIMCGIGAAVWAGFALLTDGRDGAEAMRAAERIVTVRRGSIEELVTALGKLEPKEYVDVGTQVSGQLKKIHVEIGDSVEPGTLLAEIDPRIYTAQMEAQEARLSALKAQLAEQEAQVELAVQRHERNERLIKSRAISQEAHDVSLAEKRVAEGRLLALKAQIAEALSHLEGSRTNLEYTKIYAPMAGTVVQESAREGQTLNANQVAPVILQLANLDVMTIRAQVAEADVSRLTPGMPAYFTTLGTGERRWRGTVRQILPSPEVVNDVVLYIVLIDVDNSDRQLMTGMSAQVFFVAGQAEDALLVPVAALASRAPGEDSHLGSAYEVTALSAGDVEERRVIHVGLMTRSEAEVRQGLAEGDRVVLAQPVAARAEGRQGNIPRRFAGPRL